MPTPLSELAYWGPGSDESVRDWTLEIKYMMSAHRTLVELSGAAAGSFDGHLLSRLAKRPHSMPSTAWNQWKWMIIYDGICAIARYLNVLNPLPFFWYNSNDFLEMNRAPLAMGKTGVWRPTRDIAVDDILGLPLKRPFGKDPNKHGNSFAVVTTKDIVEILNEWMEQLGCPPCEPTRSSASVIPRRSSKMKGKSNVQKGSFVGVYPNKRSSNIDQPGIPEEF